MQRRINLTSLFAVLCVGVNSQALCACGDSESGSDKDGADVSKVSEAPSDSPSGGKPGEKEDDSGDGGSGSTAGHGSTPAGGAPPGTAGSSSCESMVEALAAELSEIQQCESDEDCGASVGEGTCGCTRATPVRLDAESTEYVNLLMAVKNAACASVGGSVCDCPKADGFVCVSNKCAWNYVR